MFEPQATTSPEGYGSGASGLIHLATKGLGKTTNDPSLYYHLLQCFCVHVHAFVSYNPPKIALLIKAAQHDIEAS